VPVAGPAAPAPEPAGEAPGFDVTIACQRSDCTTAVTEHLDTLTEEEGLALLSRDLNGAGWQVSQTLGTLCPRHRPAEGVTEQ
jgi:hypothetical protein